jgi:hypothetical protein
MQAIKTALAGLAVYFLVAACSGTFDTLHRGEASPGALLDATTDAITHPVPSASAEPSLSPTYADELCDKDNGPSGKYAAHSFPGKTARDLYLVRVICHSDEPQQLGTELFTDFTSSAAVHIRSEYVAVDCFSTCQSVTFVLP